VGPHTVRHPVQLEQTGKRVEVAADAESLLLEERAHMPPVDLLRRGGFELLHASRARPANHRGGCSRRAVAGDREHGDRARAGHGVQERDPHGGLQHGRGLSRLGHGARRGSAAASESP